MVYRKSRIFVEVGVAQKHRLTLVIFSEGFCLQICTEKIADRCPLLLPLIVGCCALSGPLGDFANWYFQEEERVQLGLQSRKGALYCHYFVGVSPNSKVCNSLSTLPVEYSKMLPIAFKPHSNHFVIRFPPFPAHETASQGIFEAVPSRQGIERRQAMASRPLPSKPVPSCLLWRWNAKWSPSARGWKTWPLSAVQCFAPPQRESLVSSYCSERWTSPC